MANQKEVIPQKETKHLTIEEAKSIMVKMYSSDTVEQSFRDRLANQEVLNTFLNQDPPSTWIEKHPMAKGAVYLPIDKIEWMLRAFFKDWKVEVKNVMSLFNSVQVTIRLWYLSPVTQKWAYQDGVGACTLQTSKGSKAADMSEIIPGAVDRATPIAKTNAIKDAADHIGRVFGGDLNRKGVVSHKVETSLVEIAREINPLKTNIEDIEPKSA